MADGRWTMTEQELNNVAAGFDARDTSGLPNYKQHRAVDNRDGQAARRCAFCGSDRLTSGLGGYGEGFSYQSAVCKDCGGVTDFVNRDDVHRFF
ncbi:MAG: hypothetical protein IJH91_00045 [Mogibacterium sp.]|nr:hypothetical protein [Mogibacterium sp.]